MIDLGLAAKARPCLVLSTEFRDDERSVVTYVPRTTSLRGGRFEVAHNAPRFLPGAFDAQNINTVPTAKSIQMP
jgi:mRNA interferase MazF